MFRIGQRVTVLRDGRHVATVPLGEVSATELVRREMCAAYPLDPELEVDVGVGADWLDAK